jgi:hypothetical protein
MYFVFCLFGFSGISVVSLFVLLLGCLAIGNMLGLKKNVSHPL